MQPTHGQWAATTGHFIEDPSRTRPCPRCNFAWNNATRKLPGIATENFDDTVIGPTVIQ